MIYSSLRLLHILFMATWLGATLFTSGDIKRTLAAGPEHLPLLKDRVGRSTRLAAISAPLTVVTGIVLIFQLGEMGAVPMGIHIGLLLGIAAWIVGAVVTGGAWSKIAAGLDEGQEPASLMPQVKRMAISGRIVHTLWLVTLILMVFRSQIG